MCFVCFCSLMNSWGNMTPVQEEIKVQNTGVGEEISISAEIVAPEQPGNCHQFNVVSPT